MAGAGGVAAAYQQGPWTAKVAAPSIHNWRVSSCNTGESAIPVTQITGKNAWEPVINR